MHIEADRINVYAAAPDAMEAMMAVEASVMTSGLEASLTELVKMRASQINGCAFCIDMHAQNARARGETEQRLYLLNAWRDSPLFSPRERAALEWTESVTNIAETHAPNDAYEAAAAHFEEKELAYLTVVIAQINAWNRIAIANRYAAPSRK